MLRRKKLALRVLLFLQLYTALEKILAEDKKIRRSYCKTEKSVL